MAASRVDVEEIDRDDELIAPVPPTTTASTTASTNANNIITAVDKDTTLAGIIQLMHADNRTTLWTEVLHAATDAGTTTEQAGDGGSRGGLLAVLMDQASLLSDALMATTTTSTTTPSEAHSSSRSAVSVMQRSLLEVLCLVVDAMLRYRGSASSSSSTFGSEIVRRYLLRAGIVQQNEGFPLGIPRPAGNDATVIKVLTIKAAETFATSYRLFNIMYAFATGDYIEDPEAATNRYRVLTSYVDSTPNFLSYTIEAMVAQDREPEILALPALLATSTEEVAAQRNALLQQFAPHLHWQVDPTAFESLRTEGAETNPNVAYGDCAVDHRSRCLSMAKLCWIANGAVTSKQSEELVVDELIVKAQRRFLSPTYNNAVHSAADVVQHLLHVPPPQLVPSTTANPSVTSSTSDQADSMEDDPWCHAAFIASRTPPPLRGELAATILRAAISKDNLATILSLRTTTVSERDLCNRVAVTHTGRVLAASPNLRADYNELRSTIQRAMLPHNAVFLSSSSSSAVNASSYNELSTQTDELCSLLMGWLSLRATTGY